jgi:hypothetical protein
MESMTFVYFSFFVIVIVIKIVLVVVLLRRDQSERVHFVDRYSRLVDFVLYENRY